MTSRVTSEENSNGVTCISPTGENERGLKSVEKNTIQMITIA